MKRQPTIEDVARKTSLSISTVSLVLNNKPHVSEETRRKVEQAILELGYHPRRSARGLASKLSGNIGFILTDDHFNQTEPFYTKIFLGTEFKARELNYYILLTTVSKQFKNLESVPRFLLERNVDGVIIAGKINEKYIDYIQKLGLPVVLIDYLLPQKHLSTVLIDNRRGAHSAVRHLMKCGRSTIGFLGGDMDHPSIRERFEGYKDILHEHGIDPIGFDVQEPDTTTINGYRAAQRMFSSSIRPDAIFAANDAMAIGCMRYLKEINIRIPEDVALVGFDDIEMSSHVEPQLTTVKVFKEELGTLAVQRLAEVIKSKSETIVTMHVPVELIVRGSTVPQKGQIESSGHELNDVAILDSPHKEN